jgi:hypothetical protein
METEAPASAIHPDVAVDGPGLADLNRGRAPFDATAVVEEADVHNREARAGFPVLPGCGFGWCDVTVSAPA